MPKDREDIELAFKIELETRKVMQSISNIDKKLRDTINQKLQIKAFDSKSIRAFGKELARSKRTLREISFSMSPRTRKKFRKDFEEMGKSYRELTNVVRREKDKIAALERLAAKEQDADLKKALEEQVELEKKASAKVIKQARKGYDTKRRAFGKKLVSSGAGAEMEKRADQAKRAQEFIKGIKSHKTGEELAEGFKDAVGAMSGKDIFGLGKAGMRMSGSLLKGLAKASMAKGASIAAKGSEMGGATGTALKGIGKAMKGIGPLLGSLSKLGPALGLVGGALFALVKLFLDADAAVKEMNKTVLEGGSTWDTYASEGKNVEAGMRKMDNSLRRMRDETTDLRMNLSMGTTAKDHQRVINTLEQEGITYERLTKSFQKYTDITKQSIVYSRLFGVTVDEIAQMQAEMMTMMGSGLGELANQFDLIGRSAEDSGIAQNKFFAMLRGVSSDLALYGVRIGEATKMLGALGRVMSPRTADKFLKTFAQGFKGKSTQDRLKMMLLGGPKAIKNVSEDLARQKNDILEDLAKKIGGTAEDAKALLENKGTFKGKTLTQIGKERPDIAVGSVREAYTQAARGERQVKKGGVYGAAMASKNMSGYGAYKTTKDTILLRSGLKSLDDIVDMTSDKWAEATGLSQDELEAFQGMEQALKQERADLVSAIDAPEANKDLINELKSIGVISAEASADQIKQNAESLKNQVQNMSEDKIWKALDKKNADANKTQAEKDAEAMRKMAEEQGTRTQSIVEKLDLIFDTLFNYIYGILTDIYAFFGGSLQSKIYKSNNKELINAWSKSGGDIGKYMGNLATSNTAKEMTRVLSTEAKGPEDQKKQAELARIIADEFNTRSLSGDQKKDLSDLARASKLSPEKVKQMEEANAALSGGGGDTAAHGGDLLDIIKAAKLNKAEEARVLAQAGIWFTNDIGRTNVTDKASKILGTSRGPGTGVSPAQAAPSGQQAAAAKSEDPGSGGFTAPVSAAPPAPTGPAATPMEGPAKLPDLPDEKKMNEAVMDQIDFTGGATVNSLQDLWKALRMKGIKLDKTQLSGEITDAIHKGTHLGAQDALFEYALYTSIDPADTLKKMKASGFEGLATSAKKFEDQQASALGDTLLPKAEGNADGGIVTGISGGFARVNPAPGEGLASIGVGERIVPAGGGGSGEVHLHVNGLGGADLANFLKGQIAQGIHEYKRREKFS